MLAIELRWLPLWGSMRTVIWRLLDELPRFHDLQKPAVERLRSRYLIEKTAMKEPNFARSAHGGVGTEELRRRSAVDGDVLRVVHHPGWFVHEKARLRYVRLVVRSDEDVKALIG